MASPQPITLALDRRILEHPRAYHLRRMRVGIWLYLDLLARLPAGAGTIEVEPAAIGRDMGLPEGTIRSWLGHLRKAGYVTAVRLNGAVRVTLKGVESPTQAVTARTATDRSKTPVVPAASPSVGVSAATPRFFTVPKLVRALGEDIDRKALEGALAAYPDEAIKRALAGALAVPEGRIRKSRTALFLYLLNRYGHEDRQTT